MGSTSVCKCGNEPVSAKKHSDYRNTSCFSGKKEESDRGGVDQEQQCPAFCRSVLQIICRKSSDRRKRNNSAGISWRVCRRSGKTI